MIYRKAEKNNNDSAAKAQNSSKQITNYLSCLLHAKSYAFAFTPICLKSSNRYHNPGKKALEFLTLKKDRCKIKSYTYWISIGTRQTAKKYLYTVKKSVFNKDLDLLVKSLLYLEGLF